MKIVMTLAVRNEQDIIRENIEFHLRSGVDIFIVTDNLSTDNTKKILQEYVERGVVHYIYNNENTHDQAKWVTDMCKIAHTLYSPDWIINCDADEFWYTSDLNLKSFFSSQQQNNFVNVQRYDFVAVNRQHTFFYEDMLYRRTKSSPIKCAHRSSDSISVGFGNHYATHPVWGRSTHIPQQPVESIIILHYPLRSISQIYSKITLGAQAILNNKKYGPGCCKQWKTRYQHIQKDQNMSYIQDNEIFTENKIERFIKEKKICLLYTSPSPRD